MPVQTWSGNGKYRASHCIWKLMVGMEMHGTGYSCWAVGMVKSCPPPLLTTFHDRQRLFPVSPTLLAALRSKSCSSQRAGITARGLSCQHTTSPSVKKGVTHKGQRATQATSTSLARSKQHLSNAQRSILVSLFGIINVRNFLLKNGERGVCNQAIFPQEGEKNNQPKKNLYSNFQIQHTYFTGKNRFSPQPLHKEGVVAGQQRRTKQKLIHLHHTWALAHSRQLPSPTHCPSCRWETLPVAQHPGNQSPNTISLENACPYLLQSSCCGLLSSRSKESLFQ